MTHNSIMRRWLLAGACTASIGAVLGSSGLNAANLAKNSAESAAEGQTVVQPQSQAETQRADEEQFGTDSGGNRIVVSGARLRGQLDVDQAPILELNEEQIAAEGVASIADLITQIQNQTGSARGRGGSGRPIILVNGIRPGSFRELFQYPPEALEKVEVFPEEVAQRFGFAPDRRVINLILKENYSSREIELEFEGPSRGGQFVNEQELGYLKIADGGRINLNFTAQDSSLLTEDERAIEQTPGSISQLASDPDQAEFRSLRADSRSLDANISWAKAFIESGVSVSANANYQRSDSRSLNGLNLVTLTDPAGESLTRTFGEEKPLTQTRAEDFAQVSGSLSKSVNAFRLTSTFNGGYSELEQIIDRRFDTADLQAQALAGTLAIDGALPDAIAAGFDTANTRAINATMQNTLRGPLADLPGGELLATFDLGYEWSNVEASDTRGGLPVDLSRGDLTSGANFVIPITSRRNGFADALGSFTLNAQIGIEELSDFGTLGDYNVSLNWAPTDKLDLSATYIYREVAPGLRSLGDPLIQQVNVPVFDFVNGETVLADVITGGNPDLPAETQRDWKFAANWQLPFADGLRFTVEYIRNRSDDVTSGFPQITPAIEDAFSDRITRDAGGTLIALDRRSVAFGETKSDRLQFRLSARGGFGQSRSRGASQGGGGPPGRGGPPQASPSPAAAAPSNAGGPPSAGAAAPRRAGFMALRERVCADDGLDVLKQLVAAVRNGEDVSAIIPGLPPQAAARIVSRIAASGDQVTDESLAQFRTRMCSRDPAAQPGRSGRPDRGFGGATAEQTSALRQRLCADDGLAEMRKLVARIEAGEDVSDIIPGMDPEFLKMGLDRFRAEDGSIPDAALERFRTRICSTAGSPGETPSNAQTGGGRPAEGQARGGRGGFNPLVRRGPSGWRYFANLTHTIELANEILIAPGVPILDQLDGDATGAFGLPRHSSRLEAGLFGNGIGTRLSGRYTGSTRLNGSGLPGSSDLIFEDLATFDLRIFANIAELSGSESPALQNLRVSLRVDNVFDGRIQVRDESGNTPINYQPFLIDPIGRFVGIDIRKLF